MKLTYIFGIIFSITILSLAIFKVETRSSISSSNEIISGDRYVQALVAGEDNKSLGTFAPTFYRILDESADEWQTDEAASQSLLTLNDRLIAKVGTSFKHQLEIEGSARLRDGRVVNFAQKGMDGTWRYTVVKNAPFGIGADGRALIPYRTIAVDPRIIPLGTVLFIPKLKGIKLPSGEIHDGYVFAHDTGQGIVGNRIDVFVGFEVDVDNTLTQSGKIENMEPVRVYQVDEATAAKINDRFRREFER